MKTVRMVDTTNLSQFTQGKVYDVKGETTGDFYDYYLLMADDGIQRWVGKYRVAEGIVVYNKPSDKSFPNTKDVVPRNCERLHTIDLPSMLKQQTQRVISIPDDSGHIVDLQRIQYISPIDKGSYKVTLVSGWEMPLTDSVYSREKLIGQWRMLQNK